MARIIEGGGLFNSDAGRIGTTGNVHCDWCGKTYDQRDDNNSESIEIGHFGHLQVLDCCFEKVEAAVLQNIEDIIPWFIQILGKQQDYIDRNRAVLRNLATMIR